MHVWDIWYPKLAATGLSFCRARIEPANVVWLHAAGEVLRVEVRDDDGMRLAFTDGLRPTQAGLPMTRLTMSDGDITREDRWPAAGDLGSVVLLAGGEAGILTAWWNAADGGEWRWTVEFYNRR